MAKNWLRNQWEEVLEKRDARKGKRSGSGYYFPFPQSVSFRAHRRLSRCQVISPPVARAFKIDSGNIPPHVRDQTIRVTRCSPGRFFRLIFLRLASVRTPASPYLLESFIPFYSTIVVQAPSNWSSIRVLF